jgi:hypothetical protein
MDATLARDVPGRCIAHELGQRSAMSNICHGFL